MNGTVLHSNWYTYLFTTIQMFVVSMILQIIKYTNNKLVYYSQWCIKLIKRDNKDI